MKPPTPRLVPLVAFVWIPDLIERGLTTKQAELLSYLLIETLRSGYQPSLREAMEQFGITLNGVKCHLKALERKGWLKMGNGESRAIRFLRKPDGGEFKGMQLI